MTKTIIADHSVTDRGRPVLSVFLYLTVLNIMRSGLFVKTADVRTEWRVCMCFNRPLFTADHPPLHNSAAATLPLLLYVFLLTSSHAQTSGQA
jgi:hypothetical protein